MSAFILCININFIIIQFTYHYFFVLFSPTHVTTFSLFFAQSISSQFNVKRIYIFVVVHAMRLLFQSHSTVCQLGHWGNLDTIKY